jgi:hypothetical protein
MPSACHEDQLSPERKMHVSITFDLTMLYLVAMNVIALLLYVLIMKYRARRVEQNRIALSGAIVDYFQHSDTVVSAECISKLGGKRFIAFVDSEPLKRFRYSHIVEVSLRMYVHKLCGLELEKVYWRFPLKITRDAASAEKAVGNADELATDEDTYLNERLLQLKAHSEYEVNDISWEKFQKALHADHRSP